MLGNKKIYILGSSGFIGNLCSEYFIGRGYNVITERIDVTDLQAIRKKFAEHFPYATINLTGARAAPNVDWCETHQTETVMVNVVGAINVAIAALEIGAYPIQIASGCIYEGDETIKFNEFDKPNFDGSFYSRQRVAMENVLQELPVLIARIRMPVSTVPDSRNLINKLKGFSDIITMPNSVTLLDDLFPAFERLVHIKATGILNLVNSGHLTHDLIMNTYKEIVDHDHTFNIIPVERLYIDKGLNARRSNCVLDNSKAISLGISMPELTKRRLMSIMKTYNEHLQINAGRQK